MSWDNSTSAETVTGAGTPVKSLFGVNVTSPVSGTIVYVPITLFVPCSNALTVVAVVSVPVAGSTNFAGYLAEAVTGSLADSTLNVGLPFCGNPCRFLLSALFALVVTSPGTLTSGIYIPSIESKTLLIFVILGSFVGLKTPQSVVVLFVSWRRIETPCALPMNPSAGVNSTFTSMPFSATINLYVPSPSTV